MSRNVLSRTGAGGNDEEESCLLEPQGLGRGGLLARQAQHPRQEAVSFGLQCNHMAR